MATEEVGIRLSLQGRREAAAGLSDVRGGLDDVADAGHDVEDAGKAAARGLEKASSHRFARGFKAIGRGALGLTRTLGRGLWSATKIVTAGLIGLGAVSIATAKHSIGLASDARETASAFATVLGPSTRGVQKDLDQLSKRFGLYGPELQGAAMGFATLGKQAGEGRKGLRGFSTDLVKAGLDLGSFYNANSADAFAAIQSGLTGESDSLKRFNIFMSDAALNAFALKKGLGKTTQEMSEQEKIALRHAFILAHLGDAQGDLQRTSEGYANQQRAATNRTKAFFTMLGGPLTTAATGAFRGFNAIAQSATRLLEKRLPSLEKKARHAAQTFARWGRDMAKDLPGAINTVSAGWGTLNDKIDHFTSSGGSDELGVLADNVKALGPAFGQFAKELPGIHDTLSVVNEVTGFLADHTDELGKAMPYLIGGYIALKASQLAANVVLAASLPLKLIEFQTNRMLVKSNRELVASRGGVTAATLTETTATTANTAAQSGGILARTRAIISMIVHRAAVIAGAVATGVMASAQWALNAAMLANPVGLVIAGLVLLAGGLILAYKKSETFRGIVNGLWNNVLKPFGKWLGGTLLSGIKLIATGFLTMARFGVKAFGWLLKAAFNVFDGILSAAEKGLGWVPKLGDKIKDARAAFDTFGDATIRKLHGVEAALKGAQDRVNDLGRDRSATITIGVQYNYSGLPDPTRGRDPVYRAAGGPVKAGRPYIVGEHRPEMFVPKVDGLILPHVPDVAGLDDGADSVAGALTSSSKPIVIHTVVDLDGKEVGRSVVKHIQKQAARS